MFNRPDEVRELLESLTTQTDKDFEVIVVEDGSTTTCRDVVDMYEHDGRLKVCYYKKQNGGPGQARNYGAERAAGEYFVVLDSDCVLPEGYISALREELNRKKCDAFGGPDRAHADFTPTQKAINYAMTSFLTTGGIRGGKRKLDKFYPRSFNMGLSRELWHKLGGFAKMRFGEDIDLSIRIFKSGASCRLFPEAWVWHKRRTDLKKFFKQVHNSGIARINLYKKYPDSLKLVHTLPAVFTIGVSLLALLFLVGLVFLGLGLYVGYCSGTGCNMGLIVAFLGGAVMVISLLPLLLFSLLIFIDSSLQNRSLKVGLLSIPASFCQLTGYGSGFLRAWWRRCVMGKNEFEAFKDSFYK